MLCRIDRPGSRPKQRIGSSRLQPGKKNPPFQRSLPSIDMDQPNGGAEPLAAVAMQPRLITLTLNPALDLAADADAVVPTHKIRMHHEHADPGGGGVNVARVSTSWAATRWPSWRPAVHLDACSRSCWMRPA